MIRKVLRLMDSNPTNIHSQTMMSTIRFFERETIKQLLHSPLATERGFSPRQTRKNLRLMSSPGRLCSTDLKCNELPLSAVLRQPGCCGPAEAEFMSDDISAVAAFFADHHWAVAAGDIKVETLDFFHQCISHFAGLHAHSHASHASHASLRGKGETCVLAMARHKLPDAAK